MKLLPAFLATLSYMGTMIFHKVILHFLWNVFAWFALRERPEPEELPESD